MNVQTKLRQIRGIGEKTEKLFQKLGIFTCGDLLLYFPRTYVMYPEIEPISADLADQTVAFVGTLKTPAKTIHGKRMDVTTATVFSGDSSVECVWFRSAYLQGQLHVGEPYVFYGKLAPDGKRRKMEMPSVMTAEKYESLRTSLQPVYALTKGLKNSVVQKAVKSVLQEMEEPSEDVLPKEIVVREGFPEYIRALSMVHFPKDFASLSLGRRRLVYQEFFYYILHSRLQEDKFGSIKNPFSFHGREEVERVMAQLPYTLTDGQTEALSAILSDLDGPWVTQRLIQGDVGSGKTIVAFLSMLYAVSSGYQAAIMAPTEVLAKQHETSFLDFCQSFALDYEVVCLTGSMSAKERRDAYEKIENKDQLFIVGTHALIQQKVHYKNLALVITDEQHRFGVKQREALSAKGLCPHMLVMSATPIPRTLSMILYGNMQISAIKDMPSHRLPIKTAVIKESMRAGAYKKIESEIASGHQAYIICPLVEASEKTEEENVVDYEKKLQKYYGNRVRVRILHGKMKSDEKNAIMEAFVAKEFDVLVSTTVVEVGINNPNATIILIENANRFGLAQLHQLRGRVGRGKDQSYCILMDQSKDGAQSERLEVLRKSTDGFYIAAEDLKMRGPGDFFGIRQSGDLNFKIADIIQDADVLTQASADVADFLKDDAPSNHPEMIRQLQSFEVENRIVL